MNKRIFLLAVLLLGLFSVNKQSFDAKKDTLVFAETPKQLKINGNTYNTPCYICVCSYDKMKDLCKTMSLKNDINTGDNYYPEYVIRTADDLSALKHYIETYCYCGIQEEAIQKHGDDAVSNYFIMITNKATSYGVSYKFEGVNTKSGMEALDGVVAIELMTGGVFTNINFASDKEPVISGIDYVYLTDYDNPVLETDLRKCLTAIDDVDGDISSSIVIKEDNYTGKTLEPDETYSIAYQVSDSSLNTAEFTIYVQVIDSQPPVITSVSNLTSYLSDPLEASDLLELCIVTDNSGEDCSSTLTITTDTYTENASKPGKYSVTISAIDSSSNKGYKNIQITVIDDVKPTISGSNEYTKNTQASLTIKTIMEGLTASDNVSKNISSSITVKSDGYTDHSSTPGTYQIVFTVKDEANNISDDFIVKVIVKDGTLPVFYVNSRILNISSVESMTHEQIIDFLKATGAIKDDVSNISFIYDNYTENASKKGEYAVSLKVNYHDETSDVINLEINVYEEAGQNYTEIIEEQNDTTVSFWTKVVNFVNSLVAAISNFFSKISIWFKEMLG